MHNNTSRRRQIIQRSFIYGVMTVSIVVAVVICLLLVLGYRFDRNDGRVEQTALLQFDSFPSGARVGIDDEWQGFKTPNKKAVDSGWHTIAIERDGYRQWDKSANIKAGTVVWFNYARLVPNSITTETIKTFSKLTSIKASPDRKWMAVKAIPSDLTLDLINISDENKPKVSQIKLPAKLVSKPGKFTISEWDFGSRYILLKHTLADKTSEFVEVDRTKPAEARNISQQLGLKITEAHLAGNSGNILFVVSRGDLRKVDLGDGTISQPLVSNVTNFKLYRTDTIAYTAKSNGQQIAGIYKDGAKKPVVIDKFKADNLPLQVTTSSYFGDRYLAISHGEKVEIIKNPFSGDRSVFAKFTFKPGVRWLDFSSNGRFIIAQNGNQLASYDLEYKKLHTINLPVSHATAKKPLDWLDDYHIWSDGDGDGALRMLDFDGSNPQIITDVLPGFDVTLSNNGKRLFSVGRNSTTKQPVLQSSLMVVKD